MQNKNTSSWRSWLRWIGLECLGEVAIELKKADAEIPGVRGIGGGASEEDTEKPKGKQCVGAMDWPREELPWLAYALIVLMHLQGGPYFHVRWTLENIDDWWLERLGIWTSK